MIIYDESEAKATVQELRRIADAVERGEVKYVALLSVFTLDGAKKHGYALEQFVAFIETVGSGEYLLLLGALRDFYLDAESSLVERGAMTAHPVPDENQGEPQ